MSALWADLRFAFRMMAKGPGFTAVLVLTLALGIGASTTIFSVVNSVVLKPLPFRQPDRLVQVYTEFLGPMNLRKFWVSIPEYFDLQRACRSCDGVAAWSRGGTASIAGGDRPVRVKAAYATHQLLPMIGVAPALGRFFTAEEDGPGGDRTVILLSHGVWQRAFAGDPGVVGRTIHVDALPMTIIGVMPDGFDFPDQVEAWLPLKPDPASTARGGHNFQVLTRLQPGATLASFRAELSSLTTAWAEHRGANQHAINHEDHPMIAVPLQGEVVGSLATSLWLLQGAVLFVLLIAVANVANLLLARSEARSREVAVRHALGATRGRLIRQLLTESLVLGLVGGGLGILVAVWALDAIIAVIPRSAPRLREIELDGTALAFALALTVASSLLFGLAPILHTRKTDVHSALKEGGPRATGSRASLQVRRTLVVAEVALAVVLVIGCALMVRSFVKLQQVDLGFRADHLLTFEIELPEKTYPDASVTIGFWQRMQDRLRRLPGVRQATLVAGLPPQRSILANDLSLPGRTPIPGKPWSTDYWQVVGDDALATLGARLVRGRDLTPADTRGAPLVVVVNEAFAAKFFPGEDPIGKRVQIAPWDKGMPQTVVGVVADIKQAGIDQPAGTEIFVTVAQLADVMPGNSEIEMTAVLRTEGDPEALVGAVQRVMAELDPSLPLSHVQTMDQHLWEAVARPRFLTFLLGAFAALALLLAAVGIYGVMAYTVALRTHEIGIRMALGAQPGQVRRMVLRQATALAVAGVVVGLVAALVLQLGLETALAGVLFGGGLGDPILIAEVASVVLAVAIGASWWPARRATLVEPTVALRAE